MEYVICCFRDMKLGHILGTRSIKTAGFSRDLQGISIEENAFKSSNIKASLEFLTIAKTRARKLEIKCGDEPPWVRIPPSLPLRNKASWRFPRSLFCTHFLVKNTILGTFWAHEILNMDFGVREIGDYDIENEDAVQHPRIHLSITFEVLVGDV